MKDFKRWLIISPVVAIAILWLFCLPADLFEGVPYSTVVVDRNGELLGARVADDEQWRFPPCDTVPEKFRKALLLFEDEYFYFHSGVNPFSLLRATWQNISGGHVVSGGSTITMQVIRMSRQKPRNVWQKLVEMFMATRLELTYSKDEILALYASHAPFGGNVVGIDAAMWRYLGDDGADLSWAEAATLAVLQNSPSLIHLAKNRDRLLAKRNRLLKKLFDDGELTLEEYELAIEEPLIGEPYSMPQLAPHLVDYYWFAEHGKHTVTDIDLSLQNRVMELARNHRSMLAQRGAKDLAAVVVNVKTGAVIAYCGNAESDEYREGCCVDMVRASRSSGSILKPVLYAAALQEGFILPQQLLIDVPTDFGGFSPQNYDGAFSGAVPADEALAQSLNVPIVHLLRQYGVAHFVETLRDCGFASISRSADSYGLSIALGGAEVRLIDVVKCYASMSLCYQDTTALPFFPLRDRIALHYTFEAMREVNRPDMIDRHRAVSVRNVAWKTGTSYGARDAWAVGVTPEYAVGVWVGNAAGGGVPDLTGARAAGPVLFDIFDLLPHSAWFDKPDENEGVITDVCRHSGHLASRFCNDSKPALLPRNGVKAAVCPFCREAQVSLGGDFLVTDRSEPTVTESFFVLPPIMEQYFRQSHPEYRPLPPLKNPSLAENSALQISYPTQGCVLSSVRGIDGATGQIVCKASHTNSSAELFWNLDGAYLGSTKNLHQIHIFPSPGFHRLTVVDNLGATQEVEFSIK